MSSSYAQLVRETKVAGYVSVFDPFFLHLNSLLLTGSKQPIQASDIGALRKEDAVEESYVRFRNEWDRELEKPVHLRSFRDAFLRFLTLHNMYVALLLYSIFCSAQFAGPLILNALLNHMNGQNVLKPPVLWTLVCLIFVAPVLGIICKEQATLILNRQGIQIRNALVSLIFRKSLRLSPSARQANSGTINNVFANDTQQLQMIISNIAPVLFAPFQLAVGLYLIYQQVGPSTFVALAYIVGVMPFLVICGVLFGKFIKQKLVYSDARIKLCNEVFAGIRILKYYAWEIPFAKKLEALRGNELLEIQKIYNTWIGMSLITDCFPTVQPILIFYTYTRLGNELTYSKAFTTLTLFFLLQGPLMVIPNIFTSIGYATNASRRILNLLNESELTTYILADPLIDSDDVIVLEDACFAWVKPELEIKEEMSELKLQSPSGQSGLELVVVETKERNDETCGRIDRAIDTLRSISVRIKRGQLVAVVGPVGSGKTTFINALLGELICSGGTVRVCGSLAYHQQQPWILNATIKENIIFGFPYDEDKMNNCLAAAALLADLEVLPAGIETQIGEKGINLSGGQKARVSFARALYSSADITLLDDPLSAVDAHTCEHIFRQGILQLSRSGKTVVLITHQVHLLSECDMIIVLDCDGNLQSCCKYSEIKPEDLEKLLHVNDTTKSSENQKYMSSSESSLEGKGRVRASSTARTTVSNQDETTRKVDDGTKLIEEEDRKTGLVVWDVYSWYCKCGSVWRCITIIAFSAVGRAISLLGTFYLSMWGQKNFESSQSGSPLSKDENLVYLNTYAAILLIGVTILTIRTFFATEHGVKAGGVFHNAMLTRVLGAPISFFDTTPLGRILNRFTGDIGTADMGLSAFLAIIVTLVMDLICSLVGISISTKGTSLLILIPIALVYYRLAYYFRISNTEVRRLESISKSPVFTEISQSLSGVVSLRAFNCVPTFVTRLDEKMNEFIAISFTKQKLSCWISVRLDSLGAFVSLFVVLLAVSGGNFVSPQLLAVALTYSFSIPPILGIIMSMGAECEAMMSAVERLKFYIQEIPQEEDICKIANMIIPPDDWPSEGRIEAVSVKMRYREGPVVLQDVSFTVKGGETVGIAGRTGSGKSSLLVAIFRMENLEEGSILIDDIDTARVPLAILRSRLSIIPQDPVMFCATLRFNLDPFDEHLDEELWSVLDTVGLKDTVLAMPLQLSAEVVEGGDNLSVGQRQLLCFARALLRSPRIVILDEATAAVDNTTDSAIQNMAKTRLKGCTVLSVAHRLHTIIESDRIFVLDKGLLIENGHPSELLNIDNGVFKSLWEQYKAAHK